MSSLIVYRRDIANSFAASPQHTVHPVVSISSESTLTTTMGLSSRSPSTLYTLMLPRDGVAIALCTSSRRTCMKNASFLFMALWVHWMVIGATTRAVSRPYSTGSPCTSNCKSKNTVIQSEVPLGSGLSSSAALEVSCALSFLGLSTTAMNSSVDIAQVCQQAEHPHATP